MDYHFNILPEKRDWSALNYLQECLVDETDELVFDFTTRLDLIYTGSDNIYELKTREENDEDNWKFSVFVSLDPLAAIGAREVIYSYNSAIGNVRLLRAMDAHKDSRYNPFECLMSIPKAQITVSMALKDKNVLNDRVALVNLASALNPNRSDSEESERDRITSLAEAYEVETLYFDTPESIKAKYRVAFKAIGNTLARLDHHLSPKEREDINVVFDLINDERV